LTEKEGEEKGPEKERGNITVENQSNSVSIKLVEGRGKKNLKNVEGKKKEKKSCGVTNWAQQKDLVSTEGGSFRA